MKKPIAEMLRAKIKALHEAGDRVDLGLLDYVDKSEADQQWVDKSLEEVLRTSFKPRDRAKRVAIREKLIEEFGFDSIGERPDLIATKVLERGRIETHEEMQAVKTLLFEANCESRDQLSLMGDAYESGIIAQYRKDKTDDMLVAKMKAINDNGCPVEIARLARLADGTKQNQLHLDEILETTLRVAFTRRRDKGKEPAIRAMLKKKFGFDSIGERPDLIAKKVIKRGKVNSLAELEAIQTMQTEVDCDAILGKGAGMKMAKIEAAERL